ncbi:hypothetical protein A0H81_05802 [Grifola frondosa]|uniref:FAD-binding domain-containing protein n=1 Tax=Grifola frondosa TaxID=5627 RepID=A0A1C7MHF3_GRIFR|nr:hypothetical protein A0H81_05802 [Grifola frondosa]
MRPELEDTTYDGPLFAQVPPADVIKEFVGWEPEAVALLKCFNKVSCWTINTVKSLPTYVHRRVALAGDAAHAMAPHQASGAGQAFEDGYILAAILAHPRSASSPCPPRSERHDLRLQCLRLRGVQRGGDIPLQKLEELGRVAEESLRWVVDTSAMDDRRRAVERLDAGMLSLDATSC